MTHWRVAGRGPEPLQKEEVGKGVFFEVRGKECEFCWEHSGMVSDIHTDRTWPSGVWRIVWGWDEKRVQVCKPEARVSIKCSSLKLSDKYSFKKEEHYNTAERTVSHKARNLGSSRAAVGEVISVTLENSQHQELWPTSQVKSAQSDISPDMEKQQVIWGVSKKRDVRFE